MIKVTLGEVKTQEEKPFPKLMRHVDGTITFFKSSDGSGVHLYAPEKMKNIIGDVHKSTIRMDDYTDYNEPITIQNL